MSAVVIARSDPSLSSGYTPKSSTPTGGIAALGPITSTLARNDVGSWLAALGGFLLPWQIVWILRPGMLGGVPWSLATIGLSASDAVLLVAASFGITQCIRRRRSIRGKEQPPSMHGEWHRQAIRRERYAPSIHGEQHGQAAIHERIPEESDAKGNDPKTSPAGGVLGYMRIDGRGGFAIALLVVVAALNIVVSADSWLSAVGWVRLIALLLAVVGLPSWSAPMRRAFTMGFLLAMVGHALLALIQFAAQEVWASTFLGTAHHAAWVRGDAVVEAMGGRWLRAYGGFSHPNVLGAALLCTLMLLTQWAMGPCGAGGRWGNPEKSGRGFLGCAAGIVPGVFVVIATFALIATFSRSALLGLVILLAVLAVRRATRHLATVGALALVAAVAVTWPLWSPRIAAANRIEVRSLAERRSALADARHLLADRRAALVGVGLHAMPVAVLRSIDSRRDPYTIQPVHNVPLLALAEVGVFGVLALLAAFWQGARSTFRTRPEPSSRWLEVPHSVFLIPASLALAPPLLLDHALWSLAVGPALLLALAVASAQAD